MLRCSNNVQTRQFCFSECSSKGCSILLCPGATDQSGSPAGCFQPRHSWKDSFGATLIKVAQEKRRACPLEAGKANQRDRWIIAYMIFEGWNSDFLKWLDFGTWTSVSFSDILLSSPYQKGKSTWHRLTGDGSTVVPWLVEICKQTIMYSYILGISIHDQRLCFFL